MAFFLRVSETFEGAEALFNFRVIDELTDCRYIDQYPEASLDAGN
jgi:hypothetical protein